MKIDPVTANDFIAVYREFLLDLYESSETEKVHKKLTEKLVIGRRQFSENRDLLKVFLEKNNKFNFPKETILAIENIEIAKWVYLRDTRYYSVLLNIDGLSGYGVLGLNDKIKEIVGQSQLKSRLIQTVKEGRISHAQLFVGKSGFGPLPLAIAYVQFIACKNKQETDSCGACPSCFSCGSTSMAASSSACWPWGDCFWWTPFTVGR